MRVINFVSIDLIGAAKLITVDFKSAKLDTIPESIRGKNTSQEQTLQKGGNNHGSLDELSTLV